MRRKTTWKRELFPLIGQRLTRTIERKVISIILPKPVTSSVYGVQSPHSFLESWSISNRTTIITTTTASFCHSKIKPRKEVMAALLKLRQQQNSKSTNNATPHCAQSPRLYQQPLQDCACIVEVTKNRCPFVLSVLLVLLWKGFGIVDDISVLRLPLNVYVCVLRGNFNITT